MIDDFEKPVIAQMRYWCPVCGAQHKTEDGAIHCSDVEREWQERFRDKPLYLKIAYDGVEIPYKIKRIVRNYNGSRCGNRMSFAVDRWKRGESVLSPSGNGGDVGSRHAAEFVFPATKDEFEDFLSSTSSVEREEMESAFWKKRSVIFTKNLRDRMRRNLSKRSPLDFDDIVDGGIGGVLDALGEVEHDSPWEAAR